MVPLISISVRTGRGRKPASLQIALLAASLLAAFTAQAQPASKADRPDPLDAQASVPALNHASSLSRQRPLGDEKPVPWRDANDTVARIGGWRVYAREARQPDASPTAPAAAPNEKAQPLPAGHGGHKMP